MDFIEILITVIGWVVGIVLLLTMWITIIGFLGMSVSSIKECFSEGLQTWRGNVQKGRTKPYTQDSGQNPDPGQAAPLQSAAEAPQVPYGIRYPKAWEAAPSDGQDPSREERL